MQSIDTKFQERREFPYYPNNRDEQNQGIFRPYHATGNKTHNDGHENSRDPQSALRPQINHSEATENSDAMRKRDQQNFIKDFENRGPTVNTKGGYPRDSNQ